MAWEAISKADVAKFAGCKPDDLKDIWYDQTISYIAKFGGYNNPVIAETVTERRSGNGARRIQVGKPPVTGLVEVKIDGVVQPITDFDFDASGVYCVVNSYNNLSSRLGFHKGVKNIELTYKSGGEQGNEYVSLAIMMIMREIVAEYLSEGSNARIVEFKGGVSTAIDDSLLAWGLQGKIKSIVLDIIGTKNRFG